MTNVENPEVAEFHIEPEIVGYKAFVKYHGYPYWLSIAPSREINERYTTLDQIGLYATPEDAVTHARVSAEKIYSSAPFDIKIFRIRL